MDSRGVALTSDVLVSLTQRPHPARNCRRQPLCADGEVAILIALAPLHRMSPRDGGIAASERSVHSALSVTAWVALVYEQAAKLVA